MSVEHSESYFGQTQHKYHLQTVKCFLLLNREEWLLCFKCLRNWFSPMIRIPANLEKTVFKSWHLPFLTGWMKILLQFKYCLNSFSILNQPFLTVEHDWMNVLIVTLGPFCFTGGGQPVLGHVWVGFPKQRDALPVQIWWRTCLLVRVPHRYELRLNRCTKMLPLFVAVSPQFRLSCVH